MFGYITKFGVVVAAATAVAAAAVTVCTLRELDEMYEAVAHRDAILKMASQALSPIQRLRVVDQARLAGDTKKIDALKWEFCNEFPLYRDFDAAEQTPAVALLLNE